MTTEDTLARLEALQPGMVLPISAEYVQGAWTLFSHGPDGEEWVIGTVEGGSMERREQKAAYLVAAANAMPALVEEIRRLRAELKGALDLLHCGDKVRMCGYKGICREDALIECGVCDQSFCYEHMREHAPAWRP